MPKKITFIFFFPYYLWFLAFAIFCGSWQTVGTCGEVKRWSSISFSLRPEIDKFDKIPLSCFFLFHYLCFGLLLFVADVDKHLGQVKRCPSISFSIRPKLINLIKYHFHLFFSFTIYVLGFCYLLRILKNTCGQVKRCSTISFSIRPEIVSDHWSTLKPNNKQQDCVPSLRNDKRCINNALERCKGSLKVTLGGALTNLVQYFGKVFEVVGLFETVLASLSTPNSRAAFRH